LSTRISEGVVLGSLAELGYSYLNLAQPAIYCLVDRVESSQHCSSHIKYGSRLGPVEKLNRASQLNRTESIPAKHYSCPVEPSDPHPHLSLSLISPSLTCLSLLVTDAASRASPPAAASRRRPPPPAPLDASPHLSSMDAVSRCRPTPHKPGRCLSTPPASQIHGTHLAPPSSQQARPVPSHGHGQCLASAMASDSLDGQHRATSSTANCTSSTATALAGARPPQGPDCIYKDPIAFTRTRLRVQGPDCIFRNLIAFYFLHRDSDCFLFCIQGPDCVSFLSLGAFCKS
jgi:hypothetical protein